MNLPFRTSSPELALVTHLDFVFRELWTLGIGRVVGTQHYRCLKNQPSSAEIKQFRCSDIHLELSSQDTGRAGERPHFLLPPLFFYVATRFALFLITKLLGAAPSNSAPLRSL